MSSDQDASTFSLERRVFLAGSALAVSGAALQWSLSGAPSMLCPEAPLNDPTVTCGAPWQVSLHLDKPYLSSDRVSVSFESRSVLGGAAALMALAEPELRMQQPYL